MSLKIVKKTIATQLAMLLTGVSIAQNCFAQSGKYQNLNPNTNIVYKSIYKINDDYFKRKFGDSLDRSAWYKWFDLPDEERKNTIDLALIEPKAELPLYAIADIFKTHEKERQELSNETLKHIKLYHKIPSDFDYKLKKINSNFENKLLSAKLEPTAEEYVEKYVNDKLIELSNYARINAITKLLRHNINMHDLEIKGNYINLEDTNSILILSKDNDTVKNWNEFSKIFSTDNKVTPVDEFDFDNIKHIWDKIDIYTKDVISYNLYNDQEFNKKVDEIIIKAIAKQYEKAMAKQYEDEKLVGQRSKDIAHCEVESQPRNDLIKKFAPKIYQFFGDPDRFRLMVPYV